jgi:deoxycytidylate deaminase
MAAHIALRTDTRQQEDAISKLVMAYPDMDFEVARPADCSTCVKQPGLSIFSLSGKIRELPRPHMEISCSATSEDQVRAALVLAPDRSSEWDAHIDRFIRAIRGLPGATATADEHWMWMAYASAVRSASVSRQVGAVIVRNGSLVATGCNEVPRRGGGYCWSDDPIDSRDCATVKPGERSRKERVVLSFLKVLHDQGSLTRTPEEVLHQVTVQSGLEELLTFVDVGRAVHAELACLCDAARTGTSVESSVVYCTEEPCYQCCRALLAAGISEAIYDNPRSGIDSPIVNELVAPIARRRFTGIHWQHLTSL